MSSVKIVENYFDARGLKRPDANSSLKFLVSEVGELADADISLTSSGWVRNNMSKETDADDVKLMKLESEVGDVLMMLTRYCIAMGLKSPEDCMIANMANKLCSKLGVTIEVAYDMLHMQREYNCD